MCTQGVKCRSCLFVNIEDEGHTVFPLLINVTVEPTESIGERMEL